MGDASLSVVDSIIKKLLNVQDKPTQTEVTDITTDEVMLLCRKIRTVHTCITSLPLASTSAAHDCEPVLHVNRVGRQHSDLL